MILSHKFFEVTIKLDFLLSVFSSNYNQAMLANQALAYSWKTSISIPFLYSMLGDGVDVDPFITLAIS